MGTHFRGDPDTVRALDTYIKLMRASETVTATLQRDLSNAGLTTTQFGVMELLLHLGPCCQKVMGHKLLKSGGNITTVVDNLERRGLVTRTRGGEDRRFVTVDLTPAGRQLIEAVFPAHAERIRALLATLPPASQVQLGELCRRLGRAVAGETEAPVARVEALEPL